METYSEECIMTFLKNQGQLFDEPVAETYEEAEEFLEDCMAVVAKNLKEVREYLDESGMDVDGMSDQELLEASEVFALEDGSYLIVEGGEICCFFSHSRLCEERRQQAYGGYKKNCRKTERVFLPG